MAEQRKVVIHQMAPCRGDVLSASPFCAKVDVYCRLFDVPYEAHFNKGLSEDVRHPKTYKAP